MSSNRWTSALRRLSAGVALIALTNLASAAEIIIVNGDPPGIGFNDPTPAAPVGGNDGTTLGEQRLNVFKTVASIWGRKLKSDVPISVLSFFQPLPCQVDRGVLGAAGSITVWTDFEGARPRSWYPSALANKIAGVDLFADTQPDGSDLDIIAFFNGNLGKPDCLANTSFYLGLDGQAGTRIDLLTTVLHEVGHGLGFATFTDESNGELFGAPEQPQPSIWDYHLYDNTFNKTWADMTSDERKQSAIIPRNLAWSGKHVQRAAPRVLDRGTPELFLFGPGLNRFYLIGLAQFGPPITKEAIAAPLAQVVDQFDGRGFACSPLNQTNAENVAGKVAVIDRGGGCTYTEKVKNAQVAGAKAVIIVDNTLLSPPPDLGGSDSTIDIPSVRVTRDDGAQIKASIASSASTYLPIAVLFENKFKLAGADYLQRVYLYTSNPVQVGSSISHYDTSARPNLLMEPFLNSDQRIAVSAPYDLTLELLRDIGW
ncbi:MAG TPA: PA domain-containing protein [Burkholderiaceae bacterium]|nr:PA domain-containing protein [Burkholderiaceae bacterium]